MQYLIIEDNVISNIIVADEEFAQSINAKPYYKGANIGDTYDPPTLDKMQDQLDNANNTIADLTETIANLMYQQSLTQLNSNTTTESGGTT